MSNACVIPRFRILLAGALLASASALPAQTLTTWKVEGAQRQALVFAPSQRPASKAEKVPLIFAFHGHGDTIQNAARAGHLETFWPEAIVVYPQGLADRRDLNSGWQVRAGQDGNEDLKFFDVMLTDLRSRFPVDDTRIYAAGFSHGGGFAYLLWAERGKVLAAFGIVAGTLDRGEQLTVPRAALIIAGQNDIAMPYADQQFSIELARKVNHATGTGQPCGPDCTLYPSTSQTPVVTRIHDAGHSYPPWATQAIIEFFKAHKL